MRELPLDLWQKVFSFVSIKNRYSNELTTVCKAFHSALRKMGLRVSIDIIYHHQSSFSVIHAPVTDDDSIRNDGANFNSIKCVISPPPNPFHYPHAPLAKDSDGNLRGKTLKCFDVHCIVDVYHHHLVALHERGQSTFVPALCRYVQGVLGGATLVDYVVRGPEYFIFSSQLDVCIHSGRLPKCGAYASKSASDRSSHTCQEKSRVKQASLVVTSVQHMETSLQPLPALTSLILLLDAPRPKTRASFLHGAAACSSLSAIETLSIGYFDDDVSAYSNTQDLSVDFFSVVIRRALSVKHLSIGRVASHHHVAPLLRAALSNLSLDTLCFPLADTSAYLQLMSTQRDIFTAMSSGIRCLIISGYDQQVMTVSHLSHLIRFFANIASLRCLVFDMGSDYDDEEEVDMLAAVVDEVKVLTASARSATNLDIVLDFVV